MPYDYTDVDRHRVEVHVAEAFTDLRAAFQGAFGLDLIVTDGTRTRAEQAELYDGWINRRPGYSLAAAPGFSNHEESGPRGPRALDVCDSGSDPGVTQLGTERSLWLRDNAPAHRFVAAGYDFDPPEAWHIEYTGSFDGSSSADGEAPQNPFGIARAGGLQKIARLYGYDGPLDDVFGPGSMAGFAAFLRANWGYADADDALGPHMWSAIQRWLAARWGYQGEIDGVAGPLTREALVRADAANEVEL